MASHQAYGPGVTPTMTGQIDSESFSTVVKEARVSVVALVAI